MLKLDPKERITIVEVSNFKWLTTNIEDMYLTNQTPRRIKNERGRIGRKKSKRTVENCRIAQFRKNIKTIKDSKSK